MSHTKPFFLPLTPIITPTLHDNPRTNLVLWKIAINRAVRGVFAEWDTFGFLFGVCDDAVWAVLNTPPGQQLRARPDFPAPADLQANAGPAARDGYPGGVLRMQYHSTAAVPDCFLRQVKG
jgi:hypothetical protein